MKTILGIVTPKSGAVTCAGARINDLSLNSTSRLR